MGVKDHLKDGTGHILSLGLDLDYLHVDGADQQAGHTTGKGAGNTRVCKARAAAPDHSRSVNKRGCTSLSPHLRSSSSSSCSNLSEESVISDSDEDHLQSGQGSEPLKEPSSVCQGVGQDLDLQNTPSGILSQEETSTPPNPATVCRTKVDFALKLGYSEELVLRVLKKLGPDALINDILGELVKLGTKTDLEHQEGMNPSQFSFSSLTSSSSSSSLDSFPLLCPSKLQRDKENLRPVVLDGSNVAMSHGNKEVFSCQGIQLAVDWFLDRGHNDIKVFVPAWRKEQSRPDAPITDQEILRRLEKDKILVFTPSRRVQGRRVVCYDDRFIVKLAFESDGIIVSNDNYRDLANEKPEWKKFIDERLLMYSFVNDKFMPPDDPLGRHGPSLDNFLRKRPVIPEHKKQPCPYGKKCTYGHKCKFYHPERGGQPQRAVADELRASAKSSSAASKGLREQALILKSQSSGQLETMDDTVQIWDIPKKQQSSRTQNSIIDLQEDSFPIQSKLEARRGSSSSSSSSCSSIVVHSAQGGPLSTRSDRWDYQGGCSSKVTGAIGPSLTETRHRCESPDQGYSSLVKAYSSLSLVVPQSPESFFPNASLLSDCSSESSASSDSFSPDPLTDDGPKCHHHHPHPHPHHHHHNYHQCFGQHTYPVSHVPSRLSLHTPLNSTPKALWKPHGFGLDDHPSSYNAYASSLAFRPPSTHIPPQSLHSIMNNFPGDYPTLPPQSSMAHLQSQSNFVGRNVMGSIWQDSSFDDSPLHKGSTGKSRRNCELNQQAQNHSRWDTLYQQSPKPCYDLFAIKGVPEIQDWPSPQERQAHLCPRGISGSSFPSLHHPSLPPITSPKGHLSSVPQHQERPALGRNRDLRDRVFANLCRIFSPDLVKVVMTKNPHITDAQELAAAILMEKSQQSS